MRGEQALGDVYPHKAAELASSSGETPDGSKSQIFYPAASVIDVTRTDSVQGQKGEQLNTASGPSPTEQRTFITVPGIVAHSERPVTPVVPPGLIPPRSRATSLGSRSTSRAPSTSRSRNLSITVPEPSLQSSRPVTPVLPPGLIPSRQPSTRRQSSNRPESAMAAEPANPFTVPASPASAVWRPSIELAPVDAVAINQPPTPIFFNKPVFPPHPPELAVIPNRAFPDCPATDSESNSMPFEPFERPISHISYDSYTTANIAEMLDEDGSLRSQMSMMSIAPISPLGSPLETPSPQLRRARHVSISHPTARIIERRTDVRVSIHTNPGTPLDPARPEALRDEWDWVPPPKGQ